MVTVVDVAARAGVSVATVSRVVRNSNKVSEEKYNKVIDAIQELGYNTDTKAPSRLRKKVLLLVCGGSQDEFIDIVIEISHEAGYDTAVYYTAGRGLEMNIFLKRILKNKAINGVITCGLTPESEEVLKEIDSFVPVVQCCDEIMMDNSFVVSSDDVMMGHDAVIHLHAKGCKKIAFIGLGKMKNPFNYSQAREIGYNMALTEIGLPMIPSYVEQCDLTEESAKKAIDKLLSLKDAPDGIFCVKDSMAVLTLNELTRRGLKVPQDIKIMGCGSNESAEMGWLHISNVTQSYYEIGAEAVNIMTSRLSGKTTIGRRLNINHTVIDRQTT